MLGFLFTIAASIFGGYVSFEQLNNRCLDLYQGDSDEDDDFNNEFTKSAFGLYLSQYSLISKLLFCCKSEHKKAKNVISNWN